MKYKISKVIPILLYIIVVFSCSQDKREEKFIFPGAVWKDINGNAINAHGGGITYYEGKYYWYGENKGDSTYRLDRVSSWECWWAEAGGVSCYSSENLVDWKFEGLALPATPDDTLSDLHPSQVIERPKVIYNDKTGKFVLWMHIESPDYEKAHAGVAVSDSPLGPFTYLGSFKPNGQDCRDQTVFKDDDGRAYHIYSSEWNKTLYISLLNEDYTQESGIFTRNFIDKSREAPAVFKKGGKYYMITSGCTGWNPNIAEYAVADSMLGNWTTIGNPCAGQDADSTFFAQSTFVFPIAGEKDRYVAMFDRWNKTDLINSRYVWLPIKFEGDKIRIDWTHRWKPEIDYTQGGFGMATDFKYKLSVDFKTAQAGDTVFIKSGETLVIDSLCGTEEKPVVITSYCDKPAIIQSGDKGGLHIYNSKHLKIERIHLIGSGRKNGNTENGLLLNNCSHVTLSEIETEGYQKSGLCIYDSSDIIAEGIFAHDNGFSGIFVAGEYGRKDATRNIGIKDSKAENNPGDPAVPDNHSGNGILVGFSSNVTIEYCTATGNGWDMPRKGNGPVGIWAYESDSILIQYCIAYRNKTSEGAADGGGFDLDGGVTNSVIQYCLSYENEGSGFGLFQYAGASPWYNNTVRYCISENDGSISAAQAGVFVWNSSDDPQQLKDCCFYNNIIYNEKGSVISYEKQSLNSGFKFHNNIFVAKDELITGKDSTGIFLENSWYSFSSNYNSMKGKNRLSVEPKYIKAGKMNITDPRRLSSFFQKNAIEMK